MLFRICFFAFALFAAVVNGDVITNGSFENPDVASTGYTDIDVDDWVVTESEEFQIAIFDRADLNAPDGDQFLVFNAGNTAAGATVHQSFASVIGATYGVSLFAGANIPVRSDFDAQLFEGDGLDGTMVHSEDGNVGSLSNLLETNFTFVATTNTTTLSLLDTSPQTGGSDLFVDHVQVTLVSIPEPNSLMIGIGVSVFVILQRRKRRQVQHS